MRRGIPALSCIVDRSAVQGSSAEAFSERMDADLENKVFFEL